MPSEIDQLKTDLKESEAKTERGATIIKALEERRDALEELVAGLEEDVARLEAEGLKPLVERLRTQIGAMRQLLVAMGEAIATLTGDELTPEVVDAVEAVEELTE